MPSEVLSVFYAETNFSREILFVYIVDKAILTIFLNTSGKNKYYKKYIYIYFVMLAKMLLLAIGNGYSKFGLVAKQ
jgi:hypothetical protein